MNTIRKYPRTRHILDSRLQPGDEDLSAASFGDIAGCHLVVEEKIDGANAAISFDSEGRLMLQSRGHFLTGGPRERHFNLFKAWAYAIETEIRPVLGSRYIVYGEWVYAKHTVYYDRLPHYFLEFDVLDRETGVFLSTPERQRLLAGLPLVSVPVLYEGTVADGSTLKRLIAPSLYKSTGWRDQLAEDIAAGKHHEEYVKKQTDISDLAEGLYIKAEANGAVVARYKYVRHDFLTTVLDSASHWLSRPILPNRLAPGVTLTGLT